MLDGYWKCIWEILMPVMPLIECYASKLTDLGIKLQKLYKIIYLEITLYCRQNYDGVLGS